MVDFLHDEGSSCFATVAARPFLVHCRVVACLFFEKYLIEMCYIIIRHDVQLYDIMCLFSIYTYVNMFLYISICVKTFLYTCVCMHWRVNAKTLLTVRNEQFTVEPLINGRVGRETSSFPMIFNHNWFLKEFWAGSFKYGLLKLVQNRWQWFMKFKIAVNSFRMVRWDEKMRSRLCKPLPMRISLAVTKT